MTVRSGCRPREAALVALRELTTSYLARIGELGLQTRERRGEEGGLTQVAVLFATDAGDD